MNLKNLLGKSLLVAVGLCAGASGAWAAESTILSPSEITVIHANGKAGSSYASAATTVYYNAKATSWNICQSSISGGKFSNNLSNYDGSPIAIMKFDASSTLSGQTLTRATLSITSYCTVSSKNSNIYVATIGTDWTASTATWDNTNTTDLAPVYIGDAGNFTTTSSTKTVDVTSQLEADADKVLGIALYTYTGREQCISNLKLTVEYVDASSATTYSIEKYDTDGNLLATISDLAGAVGGEASVDASYEATFYAGDGSKKYVFDSENASNVTSKTLVADAASNVLKIYFTPYSKYTATIESVCGTNDVADITGSWYADETPITLYYPKVVKCDDGYYVTAANGLEPLYGFTFSTSELTKTVTYSLDESIVYYTKYANVCGKVFSGDYFAAKSSTGACRGLTGSNVMKTNMNLASDGSYNIAIAGGNRDSGHTTTLELKLIDSEDNISTSNILSQYMAGGAWIDEMTASNVTIPAGTELYVANDNGTGNAKFVGDYIIVRKASVSKTITSAGWATYCSPYPLDLEHATGLTDAYIVTGGTDGVLAKTSVKSGTVPANTGLLLKGDEGTATIPVVASSSTVVSSNILVGKTAAEEIAAGTGWVLMGTPSLGFYKNTNAFTVGANTAYIPVASLPVPAGAGTAPAFFSLFDGETTGINTVKASEFTVNGEYYNLAGQRVAQPTKGLYIVNGKKVIVK